MTRIHLSLRTADLQAATAFYTKLFGVGPDKVRDDYVRFAPADVPILLALQEGQAEIDHLGLRVNPEQTTAAFDGLAAAGLPVSPSDTVCCYAAKRETWLMDPDGRAWEVYAVTDEAPADASLRGACCS